MGVRLPELRKIAKKIAKDDWRTYLKIAEDEYFEEIMLQGMVIGYVKTDINEQLSYVASFIPKIGVHPKVVNERLGHTKIGITLDLYSEVTNTI